ncbi:tRNA epoxyqueuosine(34) reductase QueG [Halioxenophilus sp. WMMB6]|uniref:tRNA epoxyqueuosine(34) reductase QueG n=1 Tax=Halioxenophilus sp. WMMB6 TaxID=3073815 RepID=UPI00295F48FD|nr:tRNA epoxyqueuosine(34) reductase QueG [Halioxenophilus sp. WMMB6]
MTLIASDQQPALAELRSQLDQWARELGFQQVGVADCDVSAEAARLQAWLAAGYQGEMAWLAESTELRLNPAQLLPGSVRVIALRMNYLPEQTEQIKILKAPEFGYVSRYALGRDYHKLIRKRLARLAQQLQTAAEQLGLATPSQRAFVDSAPLLERPLADKAGLGWIGKHTLLLNREAGSWFFLGEILTSLPLPVATQAVANQCGECINCLKVCPTDAFVAPYQLDARRCISYLTIEHKGPIPEPLREAMGNRIFGCDDCQAICPWNKLAQHTDEGDFQPRYGLHNSQLLELLQWTEAEFLARTEGSAIRRAGYERWLRNIAVALGNAPASAEIIAALESRLAFPSELVREHIQWALTRQRNPQLRRRRKVADHKW